MELIELIKTNRSTEQMLQDIASIQSSDSLCDVELCCVDGSINTSSLIFGTISPMIYNALHKTPQVESTWSVVLPETSKSEIEDLIRCFFRAPKNVEAINKILPVLKRLNIVHFARTKHPPKHFEPLRSINGSKNEDKEAPTIKSEDQPPVLEDDNLNTSEILSEESKNNNSVLKDDSSEISKNNETHCIKPKTRKNKKENCQESQNIKTKTEPVKCEVCNKFLKRASGLSTHMKFHQLGNASVGKDSPTACKECGKMFKTKQEHRQHFSRVHIGARTKDCPMLGCTKAFKSNGELKAHMRTHSRNKEFMCSDCGANFSTKHSLSNHTLRKHTVGYDEQHRCDECGSVFRMLSDLKSHVHNVHRANEVRRHTCVECGKGFSHKYSLKKHAMIHTDERPIQCRICHMRFRTNSNYNKHAKTHLKNSAFDKMEFKPDSIRIIPELELSVQQLSSGDAPLHLQMSAKPSDVPLHLQMSKQGDVPLHLQQLQLANIPVMSVRSIQSLGPHEEEQLRHIASGLLPAGYIV